MIHALQKTFAVLMLSCLLAACGFHLPGEQALPPQLNTLYVQSNRFTDLTRTLKIRLAEAGVTVVNSPQEAPVILRILNDSRTQEARTVGSSQESREYNLGYSITFVLLDNKNKSLILPQTVTTERSQILLASQILGATTQTDDLYDDMLRDAVGQIIDRLSASDVRDQLAKTKPQTP